MGEGESASGDMGSVGCGMEGREGAESEGCGREGREGGRVRRVGGEGSEGGGKEGRAGAWVAADWERARGGGSMGGSAGRAGAWGGGMERRGGGESRAGSRAETLRVKGFGGSGSGRWGLDGGKSSDSRVGFGGKSSDSRVGFGGKSSDSRVGFGGKSSDWRVGFGGKSSDWRAGLGGRCESGSCGGLGGRSSDKAGAGFCGFCGRGGGSAYSTVAAVPVISPNPPSARPCIPPDGAADGTADVVAGIAADGTADVVAGVAADDTDDVAGVAEDEAASSSLWPMEDRSSSIIHACRAGTSAPSKAFTPFTAASGVEEVSTEVEGASSGVWERAVAGLGLAGRGGISIPSSLSSLL